MWWDKATRQVEAIRKHSLRVDMRVYPVDPTSHFNDEQIRGGIMSTLNSCLMRGLDVIGVVFPGGPSVGLAAKEIARSENLDLLVLSGEDYSCIDNAKLIVYGLNHPMPSGLDAERACLYAHQHGAWVLSYNTTKRQAQHANKNARAPSAPDAVEIYNDHEGSFQDIDIELPKFVSSSAYGAHELQRAKTYTVISREDFEGMGLLQEGELEEFVPDHIKKVHQSASADAQVAPTPLPNTF
jgi:hypothetical protein